ncbi:MAG: hypothetical protein J0H65_12805 [Rhizobiales bacterium]|nr:hypothetical protein [Hyphomicrobiales bacterium]
MTTGRPSAPRPIDVVLAAFALSIALAPPAHAQRRDRSFLQEDLAPPAAYEEQGRGIIREELDPVLSADGSGLPHELWSGLSAQQFAESIAALELPPRSPTLNALWRRLIGSETVPVAGTDDARFTALRVEALDQSGLIDEVAAVLARDLAGDSDPLLLALKARSEVGLGNMERGCEIARGLLSRQSALPKPMQADILLITGTCALQRGDTAAAAIQAGLLRELDLGGAGVDFLDAVSSGLKPEIPSGVKLSLLDYRIAALGGPPDRAKLIAGASPALLAGLAGDPRVAPDVRLAAGEAAVVLNVIPAEDLAPLYRTEGAGGDAGTIERAKLFVAAEREQTPQKKARSIRAFLDEARRAHLYRPALTLMAEPTRALAPVPEISWFAETAIEVGIASGRTDGVRPWASLADSPYTASQSAPDPLAHWLALAEIADPSQNAPQSLAAVESLARHGHFDPAILHRLVTVLDALDIAVTPGLWDLASQSPQPAAGHLPDTGVLSQLAEASQKRQFGRTVLLAMRTIGPEGADGAHMIALGDALRALKRAGLAAEARQLALEGLFEAWPRAISQ